MKMAELIEAIQYDFPCMLYVKYFFNLFFKIFQILKVSYFSKKDSHFMTPSPFI